MPTIAADGAARGPELTTARLILRPLTRADIPRVVDLAGDPDVALKTAAIPYPYRLADGYAWYETMTAGDVPRPFVLLPKDEAVSGGRMVGMAGFVPHRDERPVEIGYWLGKPYWGHGFMTEAVGALVPFAFDHFATDRILSSVFPGNDASRRVLERCGFSPCGRGVFPAPARGGDREVDLFERFAPAGGGDD